MSQEGSGVDTTSALLWTVAGISVVAGIALEGKTAGPPSPAGVSIVAALAAVLYDRWYDGMWPFEVGGPPGYYVVENPNRRLPAARYHQRVAIRRYRDQSGSF